ncbi:caspase family protein [Limibaculum sp. FT325]|uniref:caspase family protein n=1 Tax=Thermohalobaculum sediminis TaxID=2939436 RepID=UPI0020BEA28A|nr:caspase family protein [Limibaculum sediminis]MCL5777712.1 caspase family protein [Limibaculum sediminis]
MFRFLLVLAFAFGTMTAASAEPRHALVIGNGSYGNLGALPNPTNDARLIAAGIEKLGFETTLLIDADEDRMKRAIRDFGRRLRDAGREAVGLFYYAGHGVQAAGQNYLIPTGVDVRDESDLAIEAVEADWVLGQMESAGNSINIVVLDACRNNPFSRGFRSAERGLARMSAPPGSFIAYATAPGDVAADGTGRNSPYTAALARAITRPGVQIEQVFKQVRIDVIEATGGAQTPWDSSSMTRNFVFNPGGATAAANRPAPAPAAPADPAPPARDEPAVAALPPTTGSRAAETVRLRVTFHWKRGFHPSCRLLGTIDPVRVALGPGAARATARMNDGRSTLGVAVERRGDEAVVLIDPFIDSGLDLRRIEVPIRSLAPGTTGETFSNVRMMSDYSRCGSIVAYVTVVE